MKRNSSFLMSCGMVLCAACYPTERQVPHPIALADAATSEQQRQAFINRISALPAYLVHEASPAEFRRQLEAGEWSYVHDCCHLLIAGDGTFGKRIFFGTPEGALKVIIHEGAEERPCNKLYRYNGEKQCLEAES